MQAETTNVQDDVILPTDNMQQEIPGDVVPPSSDPDSSEKQDAGYPVRECNLDSVLKELRDYMNIINTEEESKELTESVLTALAVYEDFKVPQLIRVKVREANEALIRNRILGVNVDAIVQQVSRAYSTVTPVSESDGIAFSGLASYLIQIMDSDLKLGPTKIKNLLFLSMFVGNKK